MSVPPQAGQNLLPSNNLYMGLIVQLLPEHGALMDALARKDAEIARLHQRFEKSSEVMKALEWAKAEVARIKGDDHYTPEMTAQLETLIEFVER